MLTFWKAHPPTHRHWIYWVWRHKRYDDHRFLFPCGRQQQLINLIQSIHILPSSRKIFYWQICVWIVFPKMKKTINLFLFITYVYKDIFCISHLTTGWVHSFHSKVIFLIILLSIPWHFVYLYLVQIYGLSKKVTEHFVNTCRQIEF